MDDRRTGGCWVTLGGRYRLLQSLKESHSLTYHSSSTASIPHPTHAYAESVTVRERGSAQRVVCLFLVYGVLLEGRIPFHFITRAPCLHRAACLLVSGFESLRFWRCDFACKIFALFLVPLLAIRRAWSALLREGTANKACLFVFGVWGFELGLG